ncbi:MAG: hypothetical protein JWO30_271 [Fibrobacteres bacterium]|nr:hypothetical protein [Fibrobacterota bacterium]
MRKLFPLILLSALYARAWDPDSSHVMAGWDNGPSCKMKAFKKYWIGLNGIRTLNREENYFDNKLPTYNAESPVTLQSGFNKTTSETFGFNLVLEKDIRVNRYMYLNPFLSAGYERSSSHTDWATTDNYPPIADRKSQELGLAVGVMPTLRILDRVRISLRFGLKGSRVWGDESTEYTLGGVGELYHRKSQFESTRYEYIGSTSLYFTNVALHWIF